MRRGDIIGGYRLVADSGELSGGKSVSAKATRDGNKYFIKRHLAPVYPLPDIEVSPQTRKRRIDVCEKFEERHRRLFSQVATPSVGSGNLVPEQDFFRDGAHYYSVTEWVEPVGWEIAEILNPYQLRVLLRTLVLSIGVLHRQGVVHGDLKPQNLLVMQSIRNRSIFVTKVIDMDDAYPSGYPPRPSRVGGDEAYMSPELLEYYREVRTDGGMLTTKSDIFSLGLILHEIIAGKPPSFDDERFTSCGDAVASGGWLSFDRGLPYPFDDLVQSMTQYHPGERPLINLVENVVLMASLTRRASPPPSEPSPRLRNSVGARRDLRR